MTERPTPAVDRAELGAFANHRRKLASVSWYVLRRRWPFLILVAAAAVAIAVMFEIVVAAPPVLTDTVDDWRLKAQPIIGLATFLVAVAIWAQQLRRSWHEHLPKRLTVVFRHGETEVFRCERARLPDASSIRELAQQIGAHMPDPNNNRKLAFCVPYIEVDRPKRVFDTREKRVVQVYGVAFTLTKLPEGVGEGEAWVWTYPFDEENLRLVASPRVEPTVGRMD